MVFRVWVVGLRTLGGLALGDGFGWVAGLLLWSGFWVCGLCAGVLVSGRYCLVCLC